MATIDLHTHTTASDGTNTPAENVRLAREKGLKAIAITDHDTIGGIEEALAAGRECGVEVVPGIEISTLRHGQDVHVLGYFIDYQQEGLHHELHKLRDVRAKRNEMMVARLNELGIEITMEEVRAKQTEPEGNIGRPHIAEVLMDKGIVDSMEEAFEKYLGREGKAYVNPPRISPEDAVRLILRYGGIPVLAHPGLYDDDPLIEELVALGLKGIEVYHPDHTDREIEKYSRIAAELQLIATGGSDFHGERNGQVFHSDLGSQPVPAEALEKLKQLKHMRDNRAKKEL
ncbi:PHP domain protein [Caldalkalibacillus thermarum TA2.A1]|uniref:PHP domain protein n=1 Tax=Caldalkalibacillus thermarum (strain TA2.A1) TaxID=986075 RepID=F5L500_CALTT|nr:PHP domain-containing protein [Caldalkalibacillus thermarum]EGL83576.1 PHP domain protein [Caldalkalibacillus thermarum TA2.A1]QZT35125.1 PHP domain-containing protein [Caldalkalibacillus thermarum TA2.A1]